MPFVRQADGVSHGAQRERPATPLTLSELGSPYAGFPALTGRVGGQRKIKYAHGSQNPARTSDEIRCCGDPGYADDPVYCAGFPSAAFAMARSAASRVVPRNHRISEPLPDRTLTCRSRAPLKKGQFRTGLVSGYACARGLMINLFSGIESDNSVGPDIFLGRYSSDNITVQYCMRESNDWPPDYNCGNKIKFDRVPSCDR